MLSLKRPVDPPAYYVFSIGLSFAGLFLACVWYVNQGDLVLDEYHLMNNIILGISIMSFK